MALDVVMTWTNETREVKRGSRCLAPSIAIFHVFLVPLPGASNRHAAVDGGGAGGMTHSA